MGNSLLVYNPAVSLKSIASALLGVALLTGCNRQPSEERVTHPESMAGGTWLRSEYHIVGREVKEFDDHSGNYVVVTIKYGDKWITAQCGATWTTETGEDLPSTPVLYDHCHDLPMGSVTLERSGWDSLYYFSGSGKHREEIVLTVKKIEIR
jgi:hypothetical protein